MRSGAAMPVGAWRGRFGGAALVTGASGGIGEALLRALAARGMDLIAVARSRDKLESLRGELERAHAVEVRVEPADLSIPGEARALAARLLEGGAQIGLLVNNAGVGRYGPFSEQTADQLTEMVELNCRAPVELTQALLPAMLARGRGGLVFVASTAGFQPAPFFATYGATKAFSLMLGEALWAELSPRGIEVLALAPGLTKTGFQKLAGSESMRELGPASTPEEVAEAALRALGKKPTEIPGLRNRLAAFAVRLLPRALVARSAARFSAPPALPASPRNPR